MNNRILFSDNGSLKDLSQKLNNLFTGLEAFDYVAAEDFLYIGARLPFNHIYFKLGSVLNLVPAKMKIEYYDGTRWIETVEVIDGTQGFASSGMVQFTPNRINQWTARSTKDAGEEITELKTVVIYDRYWIRISFDVDLTPAIEVSWVGNIFSADEDLSGEFPDFAKTARKVSFKPGKTDWFDQHAIAAQVIVSDLIEMGTIREKGQILNWSDFTLASVSKVAEIIFTASGDDYVDDRNSARQEYKARLKSASPKIDKDLDGIESQVEAIETSSQGWFSR